MITLYRAIMKCWLFSTLYYYSALYYYSILVVFHPILLLNSGNFPLYTIIPPHTIITFLSFSTLYYYSDQSYTIIWNVGIGAYCGSCSYMPTLSGAHL